MPSPGLSPPPPDSPYGVVFYFSSSNPINKLPQKVIDLLVGGNGETGLIPGGPVWLRAQMKWSHVEVTQTTPPTYDFVAMDDLVTRCNANNILLDLTIQTPPQWHITVDYNGTTVAADGATYSGTLAQTLSNGTTYPTVTLAALTAGQTLNNGQQLALTYNANHQENVLVVGTYSSGATTITVTDLNGNPWKAFYTHNSGDICENAGGIYPGIADTLAFARAVISRYNNTTTNYVSGLTQPQLFISAVQMNEDYDLYGTNLQRDSATKWFVQLWQTVGPELRAHLPSSCKIVGPAVRFCTDDGSGGTFGLAHITNWIDHIFSYKPGGSSITGAAQWLDALDFHWYRIGSAIGDPDPADGLPPGTGGSQWPTHAQELAAIKGVAANYGHSNFDVWCTEVGWAVFDDGSGTTWTVTEQQQADFFNGPANTGNLTGHNGVFEQHRTNAGSHVFIWTLDPNSTAVTTTTPMTAVSIKSIVQKENGSSSVTKLKAYSAAQVYAAANPQWAGAGGGVTANPTSLSYQTVVGSSPASQNVTVTNTGTASSSWSSSIAYGTGATGWLTPTPASGTLAGGAQQVVSCAVASNALAVGTYTATMTWTLGSFTAQTSVTLTVTSAASNLSATPATLTYTTTVNGTNPAAQTTLLAISGTGGGWTSAITYNSGSGWLSNNPASGTLATNGSVTITVTASITGLAVGVYTAAITFTLGTNQATVAVTLNVTSGGGSLYTFSPNTVMSSSKVNSNFVTLNTIPTLAIPFVTFSSDTGVIQSDGLGNLIWGGGLGHSGFTDLYDGTTSTVTIKSQSVTNTMHFQVPSGTDIVTINSTEWTMAKGNVSLSTGSIARVSTFTGGGSGTFNHGNNGKPNVVLPVTDVLGYQRMEYDTVTTSQVNINVDGGLGFWCLCIGF